MWSGRLPLSEPGIQTQFLKVELWGSSGAALQSLVRVEGVVWD